MTIKTKEVKWTGIWLWLRIKHNLKVRVVLLTIITVGKIWVSSILMGGILLPKILLKTRKRSNILECLALITQMLEEAYTGMQGQLASLVVEKTTRKRRFIQAQFSPQILTVPTSKFSEPSSTEAKQSTHQQVSTKIIPQIMLPKCFQSTTIWNYRVKTTLIK